MSKTSVNNYAVFLIKFLVPLVFLILLADLLGLSRRNLERYSHIMSLPLWIDFKSKVKNDNNPVTSDMLIKLTSKLVDQQKSKYVDRIPDDYWHIDTKPLEIDCDFECRQTILKTGWINFLGLSNEHTAGWLYYWGLDLISQKKPDQAIFLWELSRRISPETAMYHTILASYSDDQITKDRRLQVLGECKQFGFAAKFCADLESFYLTGGQ